MSGPVAYSDRFAWFTLVSQRPDLGGAPASVAWCIVDHLNAETGDAWPSTEAMAEKLHIDQRSIRRGIGKLVAAGLISVTYGCGRGETNRYRPMMPDPAEAFGAQADEPEKEDKSVRKGGQICPQKEDRFVRGTFLRNLPRTSLAPAPKNGDLVITDETSIEVEPDLHRLQPVQPQKGLLRKEADRAASSAQSFVQRHAQDGAIEARLAIMIGQGNDAAGWSALMALSDEAVARLRNAERFGRLSDAMLAEARLLAASDANGEGVRFNRPRPRDGPVSSGNDSSATPVEQQREPRHAEQ